MTPEEHRAAQAAAAADAMARGQRAFGAGDMREAARWLDRARRIAGGNDSIELLEATARLRLGETEAAAKTFAVLAKRHDLREAWLGLAAALHAQGRSSEAAEALGQALSGHAGELTGPLATLADAVAASVGAAGWCCLDANGAVQVHPAELAVQVVESGAAILVRAEAGAVLGSPIETGRIARIEGFVEARDGGIAGFAWHPADPARRPVLHVVGPAGTEALTLDETEPAMQAADRHDRPLARRRGFVLAAGGLPGDGVLRVVGADGRDVTGSPVDPGMFERYAAAVAGAMAGRAAPVDALALAPVNAGYRGVHRDAGWRAGRVAVVVPVYGGAAATLACLDSVFVNTAADVPVIVVDDATPEPELAAALGGLAAGGRIRLARHERNLGFVEAANAGMAAAGDADVVLLNADTLVPPGWLDRLRAAGHAAGDIASATPLSNDATLLSYPRQDGGNAVPGRVATERVDRLAARANGAAVVEIPTAVGFCMFIRRDAIAQVGVLRAGMFAQGYGEENDWCLRARHLGWRHVCATGVFVGHVGGVSFGAARRHLLARNLSLLNRLHPGYDALIAADEAGPGLAAARRRMDLAVLAGRRGVAPAVALITHDLGGGVERQVRVRAAAIRAEGRVPVLLKPVYALPLLAGTGVCRVELEEALPNLRFAVPDELAALARLLRRLRVEAVEVHHLLGHDHALLQLPALLGVDYTVHVHDYAWFCPRVNLVGFERRYCGEPSIAGCEACVADAGSNTDEEMSVGALVARSAAELAGAAGLVAPSRDAAVRMGRHFAGVHAEVRGWDDARPATARALAPARVGAPRVVGVLGAIGIEKGYDVLLACARDAAARELPLRFVVLGHTTGDARLIETGVVFVTGEYGEGELAGLIGAQGVQRAFLPSIWPETWCFTLSEAWRAGLHAVVFDIGAPAERIRTQGGGRVIPLGCGPAQVNAVLMEVGR